MSAFELLVACVKDAAKERDELAEALEQERAENKQVRTDLMELVDTSSEQTIRIEQLEFILEYCRTVDKQAGEIAWGQQSAGDNGNG